MYDFKSDLLAYQGQQQPNTSGGSEMKMPDFQEDYSGYAQDQGVASQKLKKEQQIGQTIVNKKNEEASVLREAMLNEQLAQKAVDEQNAQHAQGANNEWQTPEIDYANVDLTNEDLKAVPEGTVGGQCGVYAENIVKLPNGGNWLVGDTIEQKAQAVERYRQAGVGFYPNEAIPEPGNSVIIDPGTKWGHVAVVNSVNEDGTITLTESNWNNDGRVSHSRTIPLNSGSIVGYIATK